MSIPLGKSGEQDKNIIGRTGTRRPAFGWMVLVLFGVAFAAGIVVPHAAFGSIQVSSRSDILSDSRPSATSNHTIAFTLNNSLVTQSSSVTNTLTVTFPSGFSLANVACGDVDVATGTQFLLNVSGGGAEKNCPNTATSWGMLIDSTNRIITLTTPSSTNQYVYVATGTQMTINIGSNATSQNQGAHWITNPSSAGIYTVPVGGTFGGSGNILVSINAGVLVQATVAESLALTVSSVAAVNCTADDGATVTAIDTSPTTVPFGIVSLNTFYIGCQDLVVSTNAGNGYSLISQESSVMKTVDGRFTIPDTTCDAGDCTVATATTWVTPTKNGLGHTCTNQSGSDCNPTYGNGKKFKPMPSIPTGTSAISFVQTNAGKCSSCSSTSIPFTSNNMAGNLIIVSLDFSSGASVLSVTDTQGNVYVRAGSEVSFADIYYAKNIIGGANTVTVKLTASPGFFEVYVHEYSGLDTVSPLDVTAGKSGVSTNLDSGFASTNFANELIFGFGVDGTVSPGVGFTARQTFDGDLSEDKVVSTGGSYHVTAGGDGSAWSMQMATFRAFNAPVFLMSNTGTVTNSTGRVKYRLSAGAAQAAGAYTTLLTYIITGTY